MKFVRFLTIFCLCFLGSISLAIAEVGIAFSTGKGIHDIAPYRFSFSWDFGSVWEPDLGWNLRPVWESSVAFWNGPSRCDLSANRPVDLTVATSGPMLKWQKNHPLSKTKVTPYAELGVGLSWLSEKEIQGRILSLHFQFEDKIGVGLKIGRYQQFDIGIRAYHYSNASIKRPNSGVNLAMISFGTWFPSKT